MNNSLTKRQQEIIPIAAYAAAGNLEKLKTAINNGLNGELSLNDIKEIVVQMYAYTGFPRSINAINTSLAVTNNRQDNSYKTGEEAKIVPESNKYQKGKENVETLFGKSDAKAPYETFAPAIDTFLKEHLFCDIFERGVLSFQDRELATISALASISGVDPMLTAHMTAAMNTGLTEAQIEEFISIIKTIIGIKEADNAQRILNKITKKNSDTTKRTDLDSIFAQGEPNPYGKFFTGQTYLNMISPKDDVFNAPIGNVTFEPGARTNWHKHSGGQILLVLAGEGRYQEKGKDARVLLKGDIVRIPPEVEHWHGAAPDSWFTHISLETNAQTNQTTWLEPVTNEEYKN